MAINDNTTYKLASAGVVKGVRARATLWYTKTMD